MAVHEAEKDADKCIEIDPTFGKFLKARECVVLIVEKIARGYIRKAAVQLIKREYQEALDTLQLAKENDKDGKCAREIQQQQAKIYTAMTPAGNPNETPEETLKRAAQDPEVQRILSDPVMQQILQQMQENPMAAQEHLKNPQVAANIRKLMAAGVIRMG